ncbi:hypothetical protein V2W45_1364193 [Cenococcum geophilum]
MRTLMLMLGLLNLFTHALDCQQSYVRVQHQIATNDNLEQAYTDLRWVVGQILGTDCIASVDFPEYDDISLCWTFVSSGSLEMVCGFRLWRTYNTCDLKTQLNTDFQTYTNEYDFGLWQVYDLQPTGDVHCK